MNRYVEFRDPPEKRLPYCEGGKECHFPEGAVMIAFAIHLLENGATDVDIHPDGEHGKKHDVKATLESHGFQHTKSQGKTEYGGIYQREGQTVTVTVKSGLGDVVARVGEQKLVAECKGGVINSRHAGQQSRLRKGLCEVVGLLMGRPLNGERQVAVVPKTPTTLTIARRMLPRTTAARIEIALVDGEGRVTFVEPLAEVVKAT